MTATTFTELLSEIETTALNAVQSLKNSVVTWEHTLVPVVESDLVLVLSQFKSLAVNMVTTLAQEEFANLSGTQKNKITVETILQSAVAAGKPIAQQDAQMVAQQAFNAVISAITPKV